MVTQSLKEYFKTHMENVKELDKKLEELFATDNEDNPFVGQDTKNIVSLIDALRIVDPAVGSGAFPMGILNKLVFILSKLDPGNSLWKEAQINAVEQNVPDPVIKQDLINQIEKKFSEKNSDYGRKLYLIQKCIYGVDIQQIAVEIAKLRFFISLLVDENIDKEKENWDVEPLPNLDFKIIQGNSLISKFMGINFDEDEYKYNAHFKFKDETDQLIKIFQSKKNEYQNESDKRKKDRLTEEIENLIIQIFETRLQKKKTDYFNKLRYIENCSLNEPNKNKRNDYVKHEKTKLNKKTGFDLDEVEKQLREFTSGNKIKPFFLWKLYFAEVYQGANAGFDIVIGNPPYVQIQKFSGKKEQKDWENENYRTYTKTGDIYCLFYEKGNMLLRDNGVLAFITSNKWMRANYGKKTREYFLNEVNINQLIDFGDSPIFENATIYTNILLFSKTKNESQPKVWDLSKEYEPNTSLEKMLIKNKSCSNIFNEEAFVIVSKEQAVIKKRIEETGTPLKDWDISICRGILTGFNEAFIINGAKKDKLIGADNKNAEIIKPVLRGRDIKRYRVEFADLWLINPHNGYYDEERQNRVLPIDINDYPGIKKHLDLYWKDLGKRQDKGVTTYNLRNCAYLKEFEENKLIWLEMSPSPNFTYDCENLYVLNTAYILTGKALKYMLAVLNSSVLNVYFSFIAADVRGKTRRYIKQYVEELPIPQISPKAQKPFITFVDQILSITKSEDYSDNPEKQSKVKKLEKEIDKLVYELYGLSEEEIEIIEKFK
jgi:hypothetical protein